MVKFAPKKFKKIVNFLLTFVTHRANIEIVDSEKNYVKKNLKIFQKYLKKTVDKTKHP